MSTISAFQVCLFCLASGVESSVPASDMYPFGTDIGDTKMALGDDISEGPNLLECHFPFYDFKYTQIWVNTNGILSFSNQVLDYTSEEFPLGSNRSMVAPFWADVDLRVQQNSFAGIYYRQSLDVVLQQKADEAIHKCFPGYVDYHSKCLFIATWDQVTYYGGSRNSPTNTFQAVLSTDGETSFVTFLYHEVTWTAGTMNGGDALTGLAGEDGTNAQAGFNAGDNVHYYSMPSSRTTQVASVVETRTNCEDSGTWIFLTSKSKVTGPGENLCKPNPCPAGARCLQKSTIQFCCQLFNTKDT